MGTSVKLIRGDRLPTLGWVESRFTGKPLRRELFEPVQACEMFAKASTKPRTGGLWCCPVERTRDGRIVGTAWSANLYEPDPGRLTLVHPKRTARVLVINGLRDLRAAIARWPDTRRPPIDWPADILDQICARPATRIDWSVAARDLDAVYLTAKGVTEANLPDGEDQRLWGWDVPTVLFLRPTFAIGRRIKIPSREERAALWRADATQVLVRAIDRARQNGTEITDEERNALIERFIQSALD